GGEARHQVGRERGVDDVVVAGHRVHQVVAGQVGVVAGGVHGPVGLGRVHRRVGDEVRAGEGLVPLGRRGGDEELVVEEGAAVGGVEEVVVHRVLLGQQPFGQVGGVEVAH